MKNRPLGNTGIQVSELALGGLFTSSFGGEFEQSRAAVRRALDLGVNYIDTAPTYANSEEVLGRIFADERRPFILSTKLGGRPQPFNPKDKAQLLQSVETSLKLLGRDRIDLLMVHEPERPGQYDWWNDFDSYAGPVLEALDQLKKQGVIRATGLGGTTVYEMTRIIERSTYQFDAVLTAFNYSVLYREAQHHVVPAAKKRGMGVIVGSPLQQGVLARRYDLDGLHWLNPVRREQLKALYRFLDESGFNIAELGVRFVLSNPDVSCALMGARSATEVEQNVAAVEKGPLPADVIKKLDAIAAMVPYRPACEPFNLPLAWPGYRGPNAG